MRTIWAIFRFVAVLAALLFPQLASAGVPAAKAETRVRAIDLVVETSLKATSLCDAETRSAEAERAQEVASRCSIGSRGGAGRPQWLRDRLEAGNRFNEANHGRYPYNEVPLEKLPGGKGYPRVDSYNPRAGEIIERKFTQLGEIQPKTALGYINQLPKLYAPGRRVANVPSAGNLAGRRLRGQMILEVPPQRVPVPGEVLDAASRAGVVIRDTTGKVLK